jgi:hypothetical protein
VAVDGQARAQVDFGGSAEAVPKVLAQHVRRCPAARPVLHDLEQHRMQIRARQSRRQLFERGRADTIDDPVPVVHGNAAD